MKHRHKKLTAIALSGLLLTAAGGALAFGGHHQWDEGCHQSGMNSPMSAFNRLSDLSDEQKTQLQKIRQESRTAFRDLRDQIRDTKDDLRDSVNGTNDMESIRQLAQKQGEQMAQMIVLRAETRNKINGVLTETQRQQLLTQEQPYDGFRRHDRGQRF